MPEAIDRHALKNHLYRAQAEAFKRSEWYVAGAIQSFIDLLDKQPTIEPEVRHGRWIFGSSKTSCWMTCSICCKSQSGQTATFSYCPNCGAKMDGGADNG